MDMGAGEDPMPADTQSDTQAHRHTHTNQVIEERQWNCCRSMYVCVSL